MNINPRASALMKTLKAFQALMLAMAVMTMSFPVTAVTARAQEGTGLQQAVEPAPETGPIAPDGCAVGFHLDGEDCVADEAAPADTLDCTDGQVLNEAGDACVDSAPAPEESAARFATVQETPYEDTTENDMCVLVSNTLTTKNGGGAAVLVPEPYNSRWTVTMAAITKWIWGEYPVAFNSGAPEVETFTRTFSIDDAATGAILEIAADNGYSVTLDGNALCSDSTDGPEGSHNYQKTNLEKSVNCSTGALAAGSHTLEFTVTNYEQAGETQASNPAGLRYKLTVTGADCGEPKAPENTCIAPSTAGGPGQVTIGNAPGSEDKLQKILDDQGYGVNANSDQDNIQQWNGSGNTVSFTVKNISKKANSGDTHVFGYYLNGGSFVPMFRDGTVVAPYAGTALIAYGASTSTTLSNVSSIVFATWDSNSNTYYATMQSMNGDTAPHAVVYNPDDNTYAIAFEDLPLAGDHDYNDVVVQVTVTGCTPGNTATVIATKIVCDNEADIPNTMTASHVTDATTATAFLANHPSCHLTPDWQFEWGNQSAGDPGRDFVGPAGSGYTTSGATAADGTVSMTVPLANLSEIHIREVLKPGFIPFTFDQSHQSNADNVSAVLSCSNDGLNYDNYDFIRNPQAGSTYYCVAWNAPKAPTPTCNPEINLLANGGFEAPTITNSANWDIFQVGTTPALAWAAAFLDGGAPVPGSVELQKIWAASEGSQYAELDSDWGGPSDSQSGEPGSVELSQDIPTVVGQKYLLSFDFSARPGTAAAQNNVQVFAGASLGTTGTADGSSLSNTSWAAKSFSFTATGATTHIALRDVGTPNDSLGSFVDNVKVTCVPDETPTCAEHEHLVEGQCVPNGNGDDDGPFNVFISKYLWNFETDAAEPVSEDAEVPAFTMIAQYTIANVWTNEDPGDEYYLNDENDYSTQTIDLAENDHYATHEVTDGDVVIPAEGQCVAGKYRLVGYKVGETLEEAQAASITTTAPDFTITGDEYVIVVNEDCDDTFQNPDDVIPTDGGSNNRRGSSRRSSSGVGEVLGATTCSPLLTQYLKMGWANDPAEVTKLQEFLNNQVGTSLPLSGFFGPMTFEAVKLFQKNYWEQVLKPWFAQPGSGISSENTPTGFVYQTTKWQINEIWCPGSEAFPTVLN